MRSEQGCQRRNGDNSSGGMKRGCRRQMLGELAARNRGDHRGQAEPQPLLVHEPAALAEPLSILYQHSAANRARYRHGVGRQLQRPYQLARRGKPGDPEKTGDRADIGRQQVTFAAIAKQREEVGERAVNRLDDPGKIENGEICRDLQRRPAMHFFQKIAERLCDEPADLTHTFNDIDQREKYQQPVGQNPVARRSVGVGRGELFIHRIAVSGYWRATA